MILAHPNTDMVSPPLVLTDGGLETTLIFHEGWDLPEFAAFPLLTSSSGRAALRNYYQRYLALADQYGTGFVLATPTWRASQRWADKLGFSAAELDVVNQQAVGFLQDLATHCAPSLQKKLVFSGQIGPFDDGYAPQSRLTVAAAEVYHLPQVRSFAEAGVDQIDVLTLSYIEEAIGLCEIARDFRVPIVIGFTVETDGTLPSGMPLADAIREVDEATGGSPKYYMINCAHPDHFMNVIASGGTHTGWLHRIGALRSNASRMSHAELDNASELDDGNPQEFAHLHQFAQAHLPNLHVIGGCCGTDHRHIEAIASRGFGRTAKRL